MVIHERHSVIGVHSFIPLLEDQLKDEGHCAMLSDISPISIVEVYSGGPRFDNDSPQFPW